MCIRAEGLIVYAKATAMIMFPVSMPNDEFRSPRMPRRFCRASRKYASPNLFDRIEDGFDTETTTGPNSPVASS